MKKNIYQIKRKNLIKFIDAKAKKYDYYKKFGYQCFGPLLYAFSIWLKDDCNKRGIKKVFFLARDGFIMKQAFDNINDSDIKTEYLYASRRSIIVPSLWKLNTIDEIFEVIAFKKNIPLKSFIKKVGLDDYDISKLLIKYELELGKTYELESIKNDKNFKKFLEEIFPIIKDNSKREWEYFNNYANHMEFNGNVAIVDIGWYGTMQKSLYNIAENVNIHGYYMGLVPEKGYYVSDTYHGFLFDKEKNKDLYDKFHYFINIFEFMFLAQHGSVKCFKNNENYVDFYDYEYENKIEKDCARDIQQGAIEFIRDFKDYENQEIICDINFSVFNLLSLTLKPTYCDAKRFGDILFDDDERTYIARPKSLFFYLVHLKQFIDDFKSSSWRIGFLKRLLKIKLPYLAINNFLRKVFLK